MLESLQYRSSNGREIVYADVITPPEGMVPQGIVQIIHGMCEHIGRYHEFMQYLAEHGFVVCGHDQIGHGRSAAVNGTGYFAPKDGWDCLVRDARQLTILIRGRFPSLPVYLLGHSMGSFVAREYITRYKDLDGVLLSGTGGSNPAAGAMSAMIRTMIPLKGEKYRSDWINEKVFGGFNQAFPEEPSPFAWLSRDAAEVAKYEADPMCGFVFTLSGYADLMKLISRVSGEKWARRVPVELPVYLFSGSCDPVGGMGKGVREVTGLLQQSDLQHLKMKLYPEGRHEMLNELCRQEVYADILEWLGRRKKV